MYQIGASVLASFAGKEGGDEKMQKKKGISLIVLVITIIVMIILATAIIISISNSGIVNRANDAVAETNEAQMKQLVTLAWSEAFFKDTTETKDDAYYLKEVKAYLLASGVTEQELNKYTLTATTSGANIVSKESGAEKPEEVPEEPPEEIPTITQLLVPTIAINENTLVITDNTANGNSTEQFEIYVDNELKTTVTKIDVTAFDLTTLNLEVGTYSITVKAVATGLTASVASDEIEYAVTQLTVPTIAINENTLVITDNTANGNSTEQFEIYVDNELKTTVTKENTNAFDLTTLNLEAGTYSVTVKAVATGLTASGASNAVEYTVEQIPTTTLGDLVSSAENYGDTVKYTANGVDKWRVFYKQTVNNEQYVYLITTERLANALIPTKLTDTVANGGAAAKTSGEYVYWAKTSVPTKAVEIQHKTLWLAKLSDYDVYTSGVCVSYFLNETFWEAFSNKEQYGDYVVGAIGTPTAEMFVASWNAKRALAVAKGDTSTYDKKMSLVENDYGYYINDITTGSSSNNLFQSLSTTDDLYIWSTDSHKSVWLASPSRSGAQLLLTANCNGSISGNYYNSSYYGLRPVVCLKASTPAREKVSGEAFDIILEVD